MNRNKKKVLVVLGGNSRERQVSLDSGRACIKALKKIGFKVISFDPKNKNFNQIKKDNVDFIFNALRGKEGEDGNAQSYFEYLGIPYTYAGVLTSMKAMNKEISKYIFNKNKILSPKFFVINLGEHKNNTLKNLIKKNKLVFPLVVKPIDEGSSIGVKICKNFNTMKYEIKKLLRDYKKLMIEQFVGGQEIQVAVMKDKALGAIELKPKRKFYDYAAKYLKSAKTSHIMPANLNKKKYSEVMKIAEKAHKALECRGVTRSDFKYIKNKFYLLEINTQPGMTDLSLVPEIAKYRKISFENLVKQILLDASVNR